MRAAGALAFLVAIASSDALAHSASPGVQGFTVGFRHPFETPSQLLSLLGIGIMVGLARDKWFERSLAIFAGAVAVGVGIGLIGFIPAGISSWILLIGACAASMAALRPDGVIAPLVGLTATGGVGLGLASLPDDGPIYAMISTSIGSYAGVYFALILAAGWTTAIRDKCAESRPSILIALRILAAWIATICVAMAALRYSGAL